ncbi:MAG: adenylate/guanylate cyclase domain-containing protein [Bacteroidota bacterium]
MTLSYRSRRRLQEVLWTMAFFIIGVNVYSMVRFWETEGYPLSELIGDAITATIGGAVGGILLTVFHQSILHQNARRRSFRFLVLTETLADLLIIFLVFIPVTTLSGVLFADMNWAESFRYNLDYMSSLPFLGLVLYLLVLSALFSFFRQVSRKFGPGVMLGLLTGRYHNPREDDRIVMFLDLKSSTTHAESLGHIRYSRLLQDCFYDLNGLLIPHEAQIYKYVGDEAIMSWKLGSGLREANCLEIYFAYAERLNQRRAYYEATYGLRPVFKAGINVGRITVAEVGEERREIEYHGDVLNTAARIQGQCNIYGKSLLISAPLQEMLGEITGYQIEPIGDIELKGKASQVGIYSVEKIPVSLHEKS